MKTIYRINFNTILQSEKQAEYLSEMHKKGWKLICFIFPFFYIFQECEPEEVIYQIDFNEVENEAKEEYVKMFEDASWEYLQTTFNFSFFRKRLSQMNGEEHIFSDEESIKDMKQRFKSSKTFPKLMTGIFIFALLLLMIIIDNPIVPAIIVFIGCGACLILFSKFCVYLFK